MIFYFFILTMKIRCQSQHIPLLENLVKQKIQGNATFIFKGTNIEKQEMDNITFQEFNRNLFIFVKELNEWKECKFRSQLFEARKFRASFAYEYENKISLIVIDSEKLIYDFDIVFNLDEIIAD